MSFFNVALPARVCNVMYQIVGQEDNIYAVSSALPFDRNDMVVTQNSASVLNLISPPASNFPLVVVVDPTRKNHSTVGDSCISSGIGASCTTGTGVLGVIQQIQAGQ
jgi:hypothetical protein